MARTERDDEEARLARIDQMLEELRTNTEALHALAKEAVERARRTIIDSKVIVKEVRHSRDRRGGIKKR